MIDGMPNRPLDFFYQKDIIGVNYVNDLDMSSLFI